MTHSPACTDLVASFEGLSTKAYLDSGGVPTIGFGHTAGVRIGEVCTPEQAHVWLDCDLQSADASVSRLVSVPVSQNQFDALVSLCYNIGSGNFEKSHVRALLNSHTDPAVVANAFLVWNQVDGKISEGLCRRRSAERAMFLGH